MANNYEIGGIGIELKGAPGNGRSTSATDANLIR